MYKENYVMETLMAFQLISKVGVWTFVTKENFVNESLYGQKAAL